MSIYDMIKRDYMDGKIDEALVLKYAERRILSMEEARQLIQWKLKQAELNTN